MDQNHEHAFLYYRSPEDIRNQEFAHRMRGVDADEVYEFLDLLADQVSSSEVERADYLRHNELLRQENQQLRAENERLREELGSAQHQPQSVPAHSDAHGQAAALLAQAQEVADQLVEEAVQHARSLMSQAQHRQPLDTGWTSDPTPAPPAAPPPPAPVPPAPASPDSLDDDSSGSGYGETPDSSSGGFERTFTYRRRTWS